MFLNSALPKNQKQSGIEEYLTIQDAKAAFDELIKNPFISDASIIEVEEGDDPVVIDFGDGTVIGEND